MSEQQHLQRKLQSLRGMPKIDLSDSGLDDLSAPTVANFLRDCRNLQALNMNNNNMGSRSLVKIFQALKECSNLRFLSFQYNNIGVSLQTTEEFAGMIRYLDRLQYLNLSSNNISDTTFAPLCIVIATHPSLLFVELKWNALTKLSIDDFASAMKDNRNLLYFQVVGNSNSSDLGVIQQRLKANRNLNQISRQRIKNVQWKQTATILQTSTINQPTGTITRESAVKNLQLMLEQQKRNKAEIKARLQRQLQDLQRQQKQAARTLNQIDQKCNNLVLQNRTLKFQLERLVSENKALQNAQQQQYLIHQNQITEANHQMQQIQKRYNLTLQKMRHQHQIRMKEINREWDTRIRNIEEQIRSTQFQNRAIQEDITRSVQQIALLKLKMQDQERDLVQKIEEEETIKYNARLSVLQGKLGEVQQARQLLLKRNNDLVYQLQGHQKNHRQQVTSLQLELEDLKSKNELYVKKSKEFSSSLDRLNNDLSLKETTLNKYVQDINNLNDQIELKKKFNREQVQKVIHQQTIEKDQWHIDKQNQLQKISELQKTLRGLQNQNSRLRLQYLNLAEVLQINVNKAITEVFVENNFI